MIMGIEPGAQAKKNEKLLIEAAFKINSKGRMLVPVIDDAHLMEINAYADCVSALLESGTTNRSG